MRSSHSPSLRSRFEYYYSMSPTASSTGFYDNQNASLFGDYVQPATDFIENLDNHLYGSLRRTNNVVGNNFSHHFMDEERVFPESANTYRSDFNINNSGRYEGERYTSTGFYNDYNRNASAITNDFRANLDNFRNQNDFSYNTSATKTKVSSDSSILGRRNSNSNSNSNESRNSNEWLNYRAGLEWGNIPRPEIPRHLKNLSHISHGTLQDSRSSSTDDNGLEVKANELNTYTVLPYIPKNESKSASTTDGSESRKRDLSPAIITDTITTGSKHRADVPPPRTHKKPSFTIINELSPNPSRTGSPILSGRLSPFLGRGFKPFLRSSLRQNSLDSLHDRTSKNTVHFRSSLKYQARSYSSHTLVPRGIPQVKPPKYRIIDQNESPVHRKMLSYRNPGDEGKFGEDYRRRSQIPRSLSSMSHFNRIKKKTGKPPLNPQSHQKGFLSVVDTGQESPTKIPIKINGVQSMEDLTQSPSKSINQTPSKQKEDGGRFVKSPRRVLKPPPLSPIVGTPNKDTDVSTNVSPHFNIKPSAKISAKPSSRLVITKPMSGKPVSKVFVKATNKVNNTKVTKKVHSKVSANESENANNISNETKTENQMSPSKIPIRSANQSQANSRSNSNLDLTKINTKPASPAKPALSPQKIPPPIERQPSVQKIEPVKLSGSNRARAQLNVVGKMLARASLSRKKTVETPPPTVEPPKAGELKKSDSKSSLKHPPSIKRASQESLNVSLKKTPSLKREGTISSIKRESAPPAKLKETPHFKKYARYVNVATTLRNRLKKDPKPDGSLASQDSFLRKLEAGSDKESRKSEWSQSTKDDKAEKSTTSIFGSIGDTLSIRSEVPSEQKIEKLVPLTKSNVVSMTTAAITAQPVQISTTLANHIPGAGGTSNTPTPSDAKASSTVLEKSQTTLTNLQKTVNETAEDKQKKTNENLTDSKSVESNIKTIAGSDDKNLGDTVSRKTDTPVDSTTIENEKKTEKKARNSAKRKTQTPDPKKRPPTAKASSKPTSKPSSKPSTPLFPVEASVIVKPKLGSDLSKSTNDDDMNEKVSVREISMPPDFELESGNNNGEQTLQKDSTNNTETDKANTMKNMEEQQNNNTINDQPPVNSTAETPSTKCCLCCFPCFNNSCKSCKKLKLFSFCRRKKKTNNNLSTTSSVGGVGNNKKTSSCWRWCRRKSTTPEINQQKEENVNKVQVNNQEQSAMMAATSNKKRNKCFLCFDKFLCCKATNKIETASNSGNVKKCCFCIPCRKKVKNDQIAWANRRESIVSQTQKKNCCSRLWQKINCCRCCKKKGGDAESRRTSMNSKKQSIAPTNPPEDTRPKLDLSLVEHTSMMKAALPVLPICLAWFCLIFNMIVPGTGTIFSGCFCLCIGIPRFSQHDSARARIGSFVINIIVGVSQAFCLLFCLVGWGWSAWWGVILLRTARKQRKIRMAENIEEAQVVNPAVNAVNAVSSNHRDVEAG